MPYSQFGMRDVQRAFGLTLDVSRDLFSGVPPLAASPHLRQYLTTGMPLGLIGPEKARSEWLVAPVLAEYSSLMNQRVGVFSGFELNVDAERGLNGVCDFILTGIRQTPLVESPLLTIVEAKRDDIIGGVGQCVAEMVAARLFNEASGTPRDTVHGCVTTGVNWRFLTLSGSCVLLDKLEYGLPDRLDHILGILRHCCPPEPE